MALGKRLRVCKFEQDPVRVVILQNLAGLPQGTWKDIHLADIAAIVRESLDASDFSHASAMFLTTWIQKLIAAHPKWAAEQESAGPSGLWALRTKDLADPSKCADGYVFLRRVQSFSAG